MAGMTGHWSTEDVDRAIETMSIIMKHVGVLPQELVDAYDEEIESADNTTNRYFYERLVAQCPDSIDYFTERIAEKEPEEEPKRRVDPRIRQFRPIPID